MARKSFQGGLPVGRAKPYQIRQMLRLVERYNLALEDEE